MAAPTPASAPPVTATLALKEWGAVACALLDGRQTLLLRKGGIHEKAFVPAAGTGRRGAADARFVLFPTVAHSHADRVRAEHHDVLACGLAQVDEVGNTFWVRVGIEVIDAVEIRRPEGLVAISDLHIWTQASVQADRLDFRPRHPLWALVVRAVELPRPVQLERLDSYGGCRSWVDLPVAWEGRSGRVVHDDARLRADADRVRSAAA